MACDLTKGRGIPCRDLIGGVKYVYFLSLTDIISVTSAAGELTVLGVKVATPAISAKRYAIRRGNASITETVTGSTQNGTVVYAPSLNIKLTGLSKDDQNELKLLAQTQVVALVQLNQIKSGTTPSQNQIMVLGATNGLDLNTGSNASGAAFEDMNGYDWTFEGQEFEPMLVAKDFTSVPLDNLNTGGAIIPVDID